MSLAYFIVLKPAPADFDPYVNGKALAHTADELDALATDLNVQTLSSFCSADPESAAAFDVPQEVIATLPPEQWFQPADGLKTVRVLLGAADQIHRLLPAPPEEPAAAAPGRRSRGRRARPHPLRVISDLEEFERVLAEAERRKLLWHLAVDF